MATAVYFAIMVSGLQVIKCAMTTCPQFPRVCQLQMAEDLSQGLEKVPVSVFKEDDDELPPGFKYITTRTAGPGVQSDINSPFYLGCDCQSSSCSVGGSCLCLARYGPSYDKDGRLLSCHISGTGYNLPVFECNTLCTCSPTCSNRATQKGLTVHLEVFKTKSKGWGARTLENIEPNTFVCEYAGEVLPYKEAKYRAHQNMTDSSYMIVLREHTSNKQILRTHVDPRYYGNAARFFNHSCDPNLFMMAVRGDSLIPRLALFTRRHIKAGEELCFDYSGQEVSESQPGSSVSCTGDEVHAEGLVKHKPAAELTNCSCGAANCRGFLPYDESLYS